MWIAHCIILIFSNKWIFVIFVFHLECIFWKNLVNFGRIWIMYLFKGSGGERNCIWRRKIASGDLWIQCFFTISRKKISPRWAKKSMEIVRGMVGALSPPVHQKRCAMRWMKSFFSKFFAKWTFVVHLISEKGSVRMRDQNYFLAWQIAILLS